MLLFAVISVFLALIFYTVGVWGEKIRKKLEVWQLWFFWVGFLFDTVGTAFMGMVAKQGFALTFHGVTGLAALLLMLIHAAWATKVLRDDDTLKKLNYHKFSLVVWTVWLIPFLSGIIMGMH